MTKKAAEASATATALVPADAGEFRNLALTEIFPCKTQPRRFYDPVKEAELAASVREKGVLQAILVRPAPNGKYEIVYGERRFRAATACKQAVIPARIIELTDDVMLDIQIAENLQRADVHPLDEAAGYQSLMEAHLDWSIAELSRRVAKPAEYIEKRLKLNQLIKPAVKDLWEGFINLGHALEIARLDPAVQPRALEKCYATRWNGTKQVMDKARLCSVRELNHAIKRDLTYELNGAPFKLDDPTLRVDGLTCNACPQRTGNNKSLFDDYSKSDTCTNIPCYEAKAVRMIELQRERVTKEAIEGGKPDTYEAPVLVDYGRGNPDQGLLSPNDHVRIAKIDACPYGEVAVVMSRQSAGKYGDTAFVCRSLPCKKHWGERGSAGSSKKPASPAKEKKAAADRGKRKQEIFNVKIAEVVRREVLGQVARTYNAADVTISDDFQLLLLVRVWQLTDVPDRVVAISIMGLPEELGKHYYQHSDMEELVNGPIGKLSAEEQAQLLILCSVVHYGANHTGNYWKDQGQVIALAEEFEIDYNLIDARVRLGHTPKKYLWDAQRYHDELPLDPKAAKPVVWESPEYLARQEALKKASKPQPTKAEVKKVVKDAHDRKIKAAAKTPTKTVARKTPPKGRAKGAAK